MKNEFYTLLSVIYDSVTFMPVRYLAIRRKDENGRNIYIKKTKDFKIVCKLKKI